MSHLMVEATVNLDIPDDVNPRDPEQVRQWLIVPFFHYDSDYTVDPRSSGSIVARVQKSLEIDLSQVRGNDLAEQLRSLHRLARDRFARSLGIQSEQVWQLDVLITDRF